jgi:uncharacterized protein YndB with AHSA1/START domain
MSNETDPVDTGSLVLVVRRTIKATAGRLFEAWTRPEQLRSWWGPRPVRCVDAQVDLRVGGRYRIVNEIPDEVDIVITGVFTQIDEPRKLVYSWSVSPGGGEPELVTVRFERIDDVSTEVIVSHERIMSPRLRDSHQAGWEGCLVGLAAYLSGNERS